MIKKMFIVAVLAIGLFASSCSNDDDNNGPSTASLTLDLNGLDPLGDDFVYEGWIIVDGAPVSTGTFSSVTFPQSFTVDATQLENATTFVLSIEPAGETGTAAATPADTKILVGDFSGDRAPVNTAVVGDFSASWGTSFLRTPTDEAPGSGNNGNDENGIWFGTPQAAGPPTAGLGLPVLPAGWKYEGWVVVDGVGPLTTGTFTGFTEVDDSNDFSGTENNAGPPVPGEDFFNNAPAGFTFPLDVRGLTAVISVEPDPDNSPAPFTLKPLVGMIGQDTAPATHDLTYSSASFPTGWAIR
ncbi:anti-sigma factor [Flavivirga abyssicola]|uniref:anti-sigma factor n=1 Tax=Flavivirga abyssicola TaxID=3063533 RepID=UPI0026DF7AA6|nr:anti-sigma factor [Flavivirga sp. MEBiC07777]WVK13482.1 anti-sigma factor [Flavivirga sp. MEBiC07777]